ncbi:catechol 2,3-dioxygenase-like lactoylglutathione lyase family enzyme [Bacillus tianshenii]|uniref:Catechol 2,3-dioxygenase-like lactoylglutathione lyase family enzyme n=1 Tax=Sutcliffiella tianshenii TaxID=1463404 RepID=A0ABS2P185_9BACI|nr:VOC family protein [Bacillus tianshenii]MBM7620726.1 catechol 2,3-dioxygenase-like lactoylglutathione lyase family enzyme [Bacillus tianshenii]
MIKGLDHLVLFCLDTEKSKEWYEKAGFQYSHGYEGMHWFHLGSGLIMLHPADTVTPGDTAVHAAVEDVHQHFRQVKENGLVPIDHHLGSQPIGEPVTRPWGDIEFELDDVDGHRWAFTQRAL